jgi:hypothetical protein
MGIVVIYMGTRRKIHCPKVLFPKNRGRKKKEQRFSFRMSFFIERWYPTLKNTFPPTPKSQNPSLTHPMNP